MVASLGNAPLPAGDPRQLAKAVEQQINGQSGLLDSSLTGETAAWVVHVASLAKRSKGATLSVGGTVIDGVLLDEIQTEQVVELGPQLVAMKAWDELGFSPMLQNLGMNPTAIATAQVMVSTLSAMPLGKADNFEFIISFVRIICDKSRPTAHWLPHLARAGSFAPWGCRLPDNRFSDTSDNCLSCFII